MAEVHSAGTDDGNLTWSKLDTTLLFEFKEQSGANMGVHIIVIDKATLANKAQDYFKLGKLYIIRKRIHFFI